MDALSDILKVIKLESVVYFRKNFTKPWGMEVQQGKFSQFHMVLKGNCLLKTKEFEKPKQLSAGDIVVTINGGEHWIADSENSPRVSGKSVVEEQVKDAVSYELKDATTTLICGHFEFDKTIHHPFLNSLPPTIILSSTEKRELDWLETLTNVIEQETDSSKLGSDVVVTRLGELLFIHLIRNYIAKLKISSGFLSALNDTYISLALSLMHSNPKENWTLETIARNIGMSRAAFALKFRKILGTTPIKYLTNWRMVKAKEYLSNSKLSIMQVAEKVGYYSESSFIRAFRKEYNQNPAKFRKSII